MLKFQSKVLVGQLWERPAEAELQPLSPQASPAAGLLAAAHRLCDPSPYIPEHCLACADHLLGRLQAFDTGILQFSFFCHF